MTKEKIHILIVDDDDEILKLLSETLQTYGYQTLLGKNGAEMFAEFKENKVDLILLDFMLPGEDGNQLCQKIRAMSDVPVIMLTAIGSDTDRIVGLELGADDYLTKPINIHELLARIKAVLRRTDKNNESVSPPEAFTPTYTFSGWTVDTAKYQVISPDGLDVSLSAGEYDLLMAFVSRPNRVLSRDQLLELTKNRDCGPFDRSIDIQVSRLRNKIENEPKKPDMIKTVRGGGYLFTPKVNQL